MTEQQHWEKLINYVKKTMFDDATEIVLPKIFTEFFCIEESDQARLEMKLALEEAGNYMINKFDYVVHSGLNLKLDRVEPKMIMIKVKEIIELSKSIKGLIAYERLVQDVTDDPNYGWKLLALDGARYINKTGNKGIEYFYPQLGKGNFKRHFYKHILILSKQRKFMHHDEDQSKLEMVLNYLYVLRLALKTSFNKYGASINITDSLLKLICKNRYPIQWQTKWNELRAEYKLRDDNV